MSIREIVNIVTLALTFLFLFWKLVAMVMGFSYRYKWVRAVDAAALSVIVGLYVFIHVHWRALYNPDGLSQGYLITSLPLFQAFRFFSHASLTSLTMPEEKCADRTIERTPENSGWLRLTSFQN